VPKDDWVQIGIFDGNCSSNSIYLEKHRIGSGDQTIPVTVTEEPITRRHRPARPAGRLGDG
jgi:hypothetical protein